MWYKQRFFKISAAIIMLLAIVYLIGKVDFFIVPIKNLIAVLFFPIVLSALLYYLLRPFVRLIEKMRVPRTLAILIVFIFVTGLIVLIGSYSGNLIISQINDLIGGIPLLVDSAKNAINNILLDKNLSIIPFDKIEQQITQSVGDFIPFLYGNILNGISALTGFAVVLFVVPIMVFYLLKDDKLFTPYVIKFVPSEFKGKGKHILEDLDETISVYIIGQALLAVSLGVLMYIGYLILGLKFALVLAFFAVITFMIPYLGSIIGVLPAILVGLADNNIYMPLKILFVMAVAQIIVGNFLSPVLMGKRMNIHPITYIIVLLGAASLYGFIGMLVAVPVYALLKVIVKHLYEIYLLRKKSDMRNNKKEE